MEAGDSALIGRGRGYHRGAAWFRLGLRHRGVARIVTLAHISDLHATRVRLRAGQWLSKRGLGWLSWRVGRRRHHRTAVLESLLTDLARQAPDQVAITGDLTHVSQEEEFLEAAAWLSLVGPPERVSAVPGNHDAYARVPSGAGWDRWSAYLESDPGTGAFRHDVSETFPSLRIRDGLALLGVCTAQPTSVFVATGEVGGDQLERLDSLLERTGDAKLCRVVMIHHPPIPGVCSSRRELRDAEALGQVLRRRGAELILHGHMHRHHTASLPGPTGPIPVVGVPSASDAGPDPARRAAYHLFEIEAAGSGGFSIRRRTRGYDPATGGFQAHGAEAAQALS